MLPSRVTREDLETALSPTEVSRRLEAGMSRVASLLFTVTWGLSGDFVGRVDGHRFQMRVRHGYSNGYTRLLFGTVEPRGAGSRVRLEFRDVRFVVVLMNVVAGLLLLSAAAFVITTLRYASQGGDVRWDAVVAGLAGPLTVVAIFLAVELVGRRLGKRDEQRMREHLRVLLEL